MSKAMLFTAALTLVACKKSPEPVVLEKDPAFWKWVAANIDGLKAVKTGQEPVFDQIGQQLERVEPGLVFELGLGLEPFELIISADGKPELFAAVKRLVAAAPVLPGTKVIAFSPRKDIEGFSMQVADRTFSGKDLWFVASPDQDRKGRVAVQVFVLGLKPKGDEKLSTAAYALLEASVGEFDLVTKIGTVDIKAAPAKIEAPLKPLKDLPATLDGWKLRPQGT